MRKKLFYHKLFQKYLMGVAISLGLASGALLGVVITGTYNAFSDGETLSAGKLNQNFDSIKIAIESIPHWTKSANDAILADGGVTVLNDIVSSNGRVRDKSGLVTPVGTISAYGGSSAPTGWLLCDGTSVSQTTYADLYAVIGCNFGCSGGNFNLPDLRGRFLRGRDGGVGRDPDSGSRTFMNTGGNTADNVGSVQVDAFKSHTHTVNALGTIQFGGGGVGWGFYGGGSTSALNSTGGNETRPINAYVNWIVKY